MNKVLLLDFDGVIFKNKGALQIVSNKAARFVKNNVKLSNKDSHIVNKYLYKSFGHTLYGLNNLGYNINIKDYNDYVYKNINYKYFIINKSDVKDIKVIIERCKKYNIKIYIFSNSPKCWCDNILDCMNIDKNNMRYIDTMNLLKPDKELYDKIEKENQDSKIYFVDDSFINFKHTLLNPKWKNIMFDTKKIHIESNINLKIINNLYDIIYILDE